jgi:general secretion pathway protein C
MGAMGFDAILKRYFPVVIGLLIALAAYFQASGMGQLVAGSVALDPSAVPVTAVVTRAATPAPNQDHTTTAGSIIGRNPFDSVTGPLDGANVDLTVPPPPVPDNQNPNDDPICGAGRVLLITASDDPAWSFAAIAGSDGKTVLRRQGDDVAGHTIFYIGWDRIWMMQSGSRCQMIVGGKAPAKSAAPAPAASAAPESTGRRGKKVPPEIAAKIHKVSENEFSVERSVVDSILENQAELMRSARIVPEKEGDKVVGIRLFGIRPDSLLGTLGLENGDRLQTINGFDMASPEKALEAYSRLRTAERLTVSINRRGKNQNIDFNIK